MSLSTQSYIFHETTGGIYERKCFGFEAAACCLSDLVDGMTLCVVTAAVSFDAPITREYLESSIHAALVLFRHITPGIACKITKLSPPEKEHVLSYAVPHSLQDAKTWAKEVTVFSDEVQSFYENHIRLRDNHHWRVSEQRYCVEVHASPLERGWQLSLLAPHTSIDGRGAFMFMDLFLENLQAVMEGTSQSLSVLKWGEEVSRLPLPGPFVRSIAETGSPPQLPDPASLADPPTSDVKNGEEPAPSSPASPRRTSSILWMIPPVKIRSCSADVSRRVKLSKEMTAKLHAASKAHGRTITQVASALLTLAFSESMLKDAAEIGDERFKTVFEGFTNATHYLIASTLIDQRARFPSGFNSFKFGKGTPFFCSDSIQLFFPMGPIRKLINVEESEKRIDRTFDQESFWDGLVTDVSDAWKKADMSSTGYLKRQFGMHLFSLAEPFDTSMFGMVMPYVSSVGDLGRLGVLESFRPSSANKTLTVHDVAFSYRTVMPLNTTMVYQYDEQLQFHVYTGGQWGSEESMKRFMDTLEAWTAKFV